MEKFTTIEVLVRSDNAPGFPELFSDSLFDRLCSICDSKETCGLKVLRLNEEKLMDWLKSSVNRICETARKITDPIQTRQLHAALSASAGVTTIATLHMENSTTTSAIAGANLDGSALQSLAFQIVADKLPDQLIDKLFGSLGLLALTIAPKGSAQAECVPIKKLKLSDPNSDGPKEDYLNHASAAKTASTLTSSQAKRMKIAQGTKPLMSFFGKK
ncbi:hypothetical protein Aperf_G00000058241 [Anoplocephala perfoliata]